MIYAVSWRVPKDSTNIIIETYVYIHIYIFFNYRLEKISFSRLLKCICVSSWEHFFSFFFCRLFYSFIFYHVEQISFNWSSQIKMCVSIETLDIFVIKRILSCYYIPSSKTPAVRKIDLRKRSRGRDDRCRHPHGFRAGWRSKEERLRYTLHAVQWFECSRSAQKPVGIACLWITVCSACWCTHTHSVPANGSPPAPFLFLPPCSRPRVRSILLNARRDVRVRTRTLSHSQKSLSLVISPSSVSSPPLANRDKRGTQERDIAE